MFNRGVTHVPSSSHSVKVVGLWLTAHVWVNGWGGWEGGGEEDISLVIQSLSHKLGRSFLVDVENMMFLFLPFVD